MGNFLTIVACFTLGYAMRRSGVFPSAYAGAFVDFIMKIAFPALIVVTVRRLEIDPSLIGLVAAGWGGLALAVASAWGIGRIAPLSRVQTRTIAMMAAFGNTSFVGFPFVAALVGSEALGYAVIYDQLVAFVPLILLSPLIMGGRFDRATVRSVLVFPPFLALIAGGLLHGVALPVTWLRPLEVLGATVIPLVLFAVGMNFTLGDVIRHRIGVAAILTIKMFLLPAVLWAGLAAGGIPMDDMWRVGLLETAMPPMVTAAIFVMNRGLDGALANAAVGVGIILAFATLPLWTMIVG